MHILRFFGLETLVLLFFRGDGLATLKPANLQSAAVADPRKIFVPKNANLGRDLWSLFEVPVYANNYLLQHRSSRSSIL